MDWSKVGTGVAGLAPTVASLLGGPLAGSAVSALEGLLGIAPGTSTPDTLTQGVAGMTADQAIALRKIDADLQGKFSDAGIEIATLDQKDRDSARTLGMKDVLTPRVLALGVTLGFFGLLCLECFHAIPPDNKTLLDTMTGALGVAWTAVVNYYFGSSAGSQAKDAVIGRLATTP